MALQLVVSKTSGSKFSTAKKQAGLHLQAIVELMQEFERADMNDPARWEAAHSAIQQEPLDVRVRSGWHSLNAVAPANPEEYEILLCTGGPAVRIHGDLEDGTPTTAHLEYQDWGTLWAPYRNAIKKERDHLLRFAEQFYYGE